MSADRTPEMSRALPTGAEDRKDIPLYWGLVNYFRDALIAVAKLSMIGNEQHIPGEPLRWERKKGGDQLDAQMRHLFQIGGIDWQKVPHSVRNAWRALATCQIELEETPWDTPVAEIIKLIRERRESEKMDGCEHLEKAHFPWTLRKGGICAPTPPDEAFANTSVIVLQHFKHTTAHNMVSSRMKAFGPFPNMDEAGYFAKSLRADSGPVTYVTLQNVSKLRMKKC